MNAQLTPEQRAQRTDEPRIERLRRTHIVDLHSMRAIVGDLNLPVRTNTGGHYLRTNEDIRNDILRAHGERVAAIKIERVLRGFVARRRAARLRELIVGAPRLESLPPALLLHVLDCSRDQQSDRALFCTSRSIERDLHRYFSETLLGGTAEGRALLGLGGGVRKLHALYYMFNMKKKLRTNILRHSSGLRATQEELQENNPIDRLVLVLSLKCGSAFLLRWDDEAEGWSSGETALEINADIDSDLVSALHVLDTQTFACVTIFSNIEEVQRGYEEEDDYWLMLPDLFRHNYLREFDDASPIPNDLDDLRENYGGNVNDDHASLPSNMTYGRDIVEVCRMGLKLHLRDFGNNKTMFLGATYCDSYWDAIDREPEWVERVDDTSNSSFAIRDFLLDAVEQSYEAGWRRIGGGYYGWSGLELASVYS